MNNASKLTTKTNTCSVFIHFFWMTPHYNTVIKSPLEKLCSPHISLFHRRKPNPLLLILLLVL